MAHWRLKIEKQFADEIVAGNKMFEVRKEDDKIFQKGDTVEFAVGSVGFLANGESVYATTEAHRIHNTEYEITYVLHGWGIKEDYCVFGIRPKEDAEDACEN